MKKQRDIIIMERGVYKKINGKGKIIIPNHKKNEIKNESEAVLDGIGRIQLKVKILNRIGIKLGDKLEIYESGRNIILKKANPIINTSRKTKMYVDDKYEIKIEVSELNFNSKHRITTVDELGRLLIWHEIREKLGITEKDKLKVCVKDNMIILIPKRRY